MKEQDKETLKQKLRKTADTSMGYSPTLYLTDAISLIDSIPVTDIEDKVENLKEYIKKSINEIDSDLWEDRDSLQYEDILDKIKELGL